MFKKDTFKADLIAKLEAFLTKATTGKGCRPEEYHAFVKQLLEKLKEGK